MKEKSVKKQEIGMWTGWILKSLLCSYIVTGIFLLLLTLLLYKMNLDEKKVALGITLVYVTSSLAGGFVSGKMAKVKKYLWGLVTGVTYFLLLFIISFVLYRSVQDNGIHIATTFLLCAGSGMLGGMLS